MPRSSLNTKARGVEAALFALALAAERRDTETAGHCQRLAELAVRFGNRLALSESDIGTLRRGAYLHDIGKVAVPDAILYKAGPLTEQEWQIMRTHPVRGEEICRPIACLSPVLPVIRHHHERFDGSGYPDGLQGEQIPLLARVLQVADVYDALTSQRTYKRGMSHREAIDLLRQEVRKGWRDPHMVEVFAGMFPALVERQTRRAIA